MTEQEVFTKVVTHLLNQGERAETSEGGCLYRTPSGLKCAVGCLIPDDKYRPGMETDGAGWSLRYILGLLHLQTHYWLLRRLQLVHDTQECGEWRSQLTVIANDYGLIMPGDSDE